MHSLGKSNAVSHVSISRIAKCKPTLILACMVLLWHLYLQERLCAWTPGIWQIVWQYNIFFTEDLLTNFVVGLTMTHPNNFPREPYGPSVVPHLKVCLEFTGQAGPVYTLKCSQPVWGRFLVITKEIFQALQMPLAEVIVDSECKYILFIFNGITPWRVMQLI